MKMLDKTMAILPLQDLSLDVQIRTAYGVERIYPVCSLSKDLCEITGRKTWAPEHLEKLEGLGVKINYVLKCVNLGV